MIGNAAGGACVALISVRVSDIEGFALVRLAWAQRSQMLTDVELALFQIDEKLYKRMVLTFRKVDLCYSESIFLQSIKAQSVSRWRKQRQTPPLDP